MTNVIQFPKIKKNSPPQTMEELLETVNETRKEQVEYLLDEILSNAFRILYEEGFDLNKDHCIHSTALMVETFKAAIYRSVGIEHTLHTLADDIMVITDGDDKIPVDILSETE